MKIDKATYRVGLFILSCGLGSIFNDGGVGVATFGLGLMLAAILNPQK